MVLIQQEGVTSSERQDVFNLKGEYELHPKNGMFLLVIF